MPCFFSLGEDKCCVIRISEPIKSHWAKENNLDLQQLMSCDDYKEKHRKAMINWSDEVRNRDPGYFCKAACEKGCLFINSSCRICYWCFAAPVKQIWIVSDVRRKSDVEWFKDNYGERVKLVRIKADENVREKRGWKFTEGLKNDDLKKYLYIINFRGG